MARRDTPVKEPFETVIARSVTSVLKPAGFRKSGSSYHRRHGDVVQVVNIQASHGSTSTEKTFFVNVGIAFDAVCRLVNLPVLEKPKEYECDQRGTRDRLENLIGDVPKSWSIDVSDEIEPIVAQLRSRVEALLGELNRVDSLHAYRSHPWFDRFRPKRENAQILYLLDDLNGAWEEVSNLAKKFADRRNANAPSWWIEQLGLEPLRPRFG